VLAVKTAANAVARGRRKTGQRRRGETAVGNRRKVRRSSIFQRLRRNGNRHKRGGMTVHLVKLCVGVESIRELVDWQQNRLKERKKRKAPLELVHVTRMTPKRIDELLDGGSLYWVIKGHISARHRLIGFRHVTKNGVPHCGIVYDPQLVPTVRRFRSPFQGWRYLAAEDAPPDVRELKAGNLPDALKIELADLGLL
jgi:hypothetical protein